MLIESELGANISDDYFSVRVVVALVSLEGAHDRTRSDKASITYDELVFNREEIRVEKRFGSVKQFSVMCGDNGGEVKRDEQSMGVDTDQCCVAMQQSSIS